MSKLFRKYKQQILVVGMCLLMVAWLFPQAVQQFGRGGFSSTFARFEGGRLSGSDYHDAQTELRAIGEVSPLLLGGIGLTDASLHLTQNATEHWMLLCYEAKKSGFIAGEGDGRAVVNRLVTDIASNPMMQYRLFNGARDKAAIQDMFDQAYNRAAASMGSAALVDHALAKLQGVGRMLGAWRSLGAIVSGKEAALTGWDRFDAVIADIALVPASAVAGELTPPDEARVKEHFEKYKSIKSNPADGTLGIGYLREPAVQVEWFSVARQAVIDAQPADPIEVNKFWRQNKAQFGGGDDYSAVKSAVETAYKQQAGTKLLDRAAEAINRVVLRSMSGVENDGKYKKLPADWASKMPKLDDFAAAARTGLGLPDAQGMVITSPSDGKFYTQSELALKTGVGQATGRVNQVQFAAFPGACLNVKELGKEAPEATQVGLLYGPLTDSTGQNQYFFRVLAVRPQSPPDNPGEVMDRITSDIKLLDGFELLKSRQDQYKAKLVEKGVAGLLADVPGIKSALDAEITRLNIRAADPTKLMPLTEADTEGVRKAALDAVASWDPKADVGSMDAAARSLAVADPASRGLVLIQIKARRPLTEEKLVESDAEIMSATRQKLMMVQGVESPYSFDALTARLKYVSVGVEKKKEDEEKKKAADAAKPAQAATGG